MGRGRADSAAGRARGAGLALATPALRAHRPIDRRGGSRFSGRMARRIAVPQLYRRDTRPVGESEARKSVGQGTHVAVRVNISGRRIIKKKRTRANNYYTK